MSDSLTILGDFFASDLFKKNMPVMISAMIVVFIIGAGAMFLYMKFIYTKMLQNKVSELKEKNKQLNKDIKEVKGINDTLKDKADCFDRIKVELDQAKEENISLTDELNGANAEISSLMSKLKKAEKEREEIKKQSKQFEFVAEKKAYQSNVGVEPALDEFVMK